MEDIIIEVYRMTEHGELDVWYDLSIGNEYVEFNGRDVFYLISKLKEFKIIYSIELC